ncbi:hypothetical protein HHL17_28015 [Chitinophaga sp. G-6-1-13]|uniref:Uncharacterized protein n=1 Tax=Chitinophaga fulva TaxID=2728842 RepID=A0A848GV60_9BACT|nr:hypothetical protein [Chitinophaga fulva]NML41072.1 hypothetical protein [Chitinophaga fulva]
MIFCLLLISTACRKVDQNITTVEERPWLVTSEVSLQWRNTNKYTYPLNMVTGDTVMLLGNFFPGKPGSVIRVGNVEIVPVETGTAPWMIRTPWDRTDSVTKKLDMVRFVVTKEMGLGTRIPVTVSANGFTYEGPVVSIRQLAQGLSRTDTTLWVDKVGSYLPADLSGYRPFYNSMVNDPSVSGAGHVYFNNKDGLYKLADGVVTTILKNKQKLTAGSESFEITQISSSAVSFDEETLYFSAAVKEDTPDTTDNFICRFVKMDIASGAISTLNRTLVKKRGSQKELISKFQGNVSSLKLVAGHIKTTPSGQLFFINVYRPEIPEPPVTTNNLWYENYILNNNYDMIGYYSDVINNLCTLSASLEVRSVASQQEGGAPGAPGYSAFLTTCYFPSTDGASALFCDKADFSSSVGLLDLQQQELVGTSTAQWMNYLFKSYDTAQATRYSEKEIFFGIGEINNGNFMLLPDNNVLTQFNTSLVSVNLAEKSIYCYAGMEAGVGTFPPDQNQETGKSKYVNFNSSLRFAGVDRQGAIYYYQYKGDYYNGVTFYKLYPKK